MRRSLLIASSLLLSLSAIAPATAVVEPVAATDLSEFQGLPLYGLAYADLGTISQVDTNAGVVGVSGKHGEFAIISTSMLAREGKRLRAPLLTVGDVKYASTRNLAQPGATLVAPQVIIRESRLR